jgi:hypothetical protein
MKVEGWSSDRVRRAFAASILLGLLSAVGCGSGERELPIVSGKTTNAAGADTSTDYPLGKPAPKKLPAKVSKGFAPIQVPAGPGNK